MDSEVRVPDDLKQVFVVDDEKNIARALEVLLRNVHGASVRSFTRPLLAYEQAKELKPDLMVVDMMMPTMDGVTLVRMLRKEGVDSEVIFLTAEPDLTIKNLIPENRVRTVFPKPYNTKLLLQEVKDALDDGEKTDNPDDQDA